MDTLDRQPLVTIVGQTATGKTGLAIEIAKKYNGEIICADSRTVYRGMDIGTAKPNSEEQQQVRHHLLDVVDPDQKFTVADFKRLAQEAIDDISSRSKLPILVGGSGLYIDSILFDYQFRTEDGLDKTLTADMSVEDMQAKILDMGLELPNNSKNPRHLSRVIESGQNAPVNRELRADSLVIGLSPDSDYLSQNIRKRTQAMVDQGLITEIRALVKRFGWDHYAFQNPAYVAFRDYINGVENLEQAIDKVIAADLKLAKKQATWFKRNKSIHWLSDPSKYVASTTTLVNNFIHKD
jgi:tRNA dimethylallyltransferase